MRWGWFSWCEQVSVVKKWYNMVDVREDLMGREDLSVWQQLTDSRDCFTPSVTTNRAIAWAVRPAAGSGGSRTSGNDGHPFKLWLLDSEAPPTQGIVQTRAGLDGCRFSMFPHTRATSPGISSYFFYNLQCGCLVICVTEGNWSRNLKGFSSGWFCNSCSTGHRNQYFHFK